MTVTIKDAGATRLVEITGLQRGFGGVVFHSRTETRLSRETLEAILAVKGEMWLRNEIARAELPAYVEEPLRRQFERFASIRGRRVLDFGCGCGGSSICLARLGAAHVVGVDPRPEFVRVARLLGRDSGPAGRVIFETLSNTASLPFEDGVFDAVLMNAVLEHIPPKQRRKHLREIWRLVASGGHLFINETPNRLWPRDRHTTGLWWVPYMPLRLAVRYAVVRRALPAGATPNGALDEGICGCTYWEISASLGRQARCLNPHCGDEVALFWENSFARPGQSAGRLTLKRSFYAVHRGIDRSVLRPLGVPAAAFLPELSLCFEKAARSRPQGSV